MPPDHPTAPTPIGEQLRTARQQQNLSLEGLCAIVQAAGGSLTPGALSHIETGKRGTTTATLQQVAAALGLVLDLAEAP